jgi:hypothetical protein
MAIQTLYPNQKPSLLLDFANVKALDPRVSFVRTTTAAYYDGKTVAKAEENLFQQSQTFGNAYWTKNNVTITDDSTTAPDGTTTAELMFPTTTGTFRQLRRSDATGQTVSIFAKASGLNFLNIGVVATSANYTWFDLSTGAVGTTSALVSSATITNAGNGWYRCAVVFTSAQTDLRIGVADSDGNTTATNSGTDGIFIWGAQLEQRSAVTAYTPTTTQPITNYIPVLLTAASGVARFDHNPVTGESLGLLVEEQRANLLTYSAQFDDAAWTKTNSSITANTIVAPDGTLTGDKLVEDTSTGNHVVQQSHSFTSGTLYSLSVYAKAAERTSMRMILQSGAFGTAISWRFNLSLGTTTAVSGTTNTTAIITPVGNGWYRCTINTFAATATASAAVQVYTENASNQASYTGDGYSGIYIWGAQLEAGAFPTSYIPTVAATVTRNADAASMTGTNFSSWYSASNVGSVYVEANEFGGNNSGPWWLNSGTNGRGIAYRRVGTLSAASLIMNYRQLDATNRITTVTDGPIPFGQSNKVATSFDAANTSVSVNGKTAVSSSGSNLYPTVDQLRIGFSQVAGDSPFIWCGTIKKLAYYPSRLTDAQLQALTS